MEKMWAGRFSKALDSTADDFNSSLRVDCRMYREDIEGSMAHAAMLGAQGIISKEDADAIISALGDILDEKIVIADRADNFVKSLICHSFSLRS